MASLDRGTLEVGACHNRYRQQPNEIEDEDGDGQEVGSGVRGGTLHDEIAVPLLGGTALAGTEERPFLEVVAVRNLAAASYLGAGRRVPMIRGVGERQRLPPKVAFPLHSRTSDRSRTDSEDERWLGW